MVPTQAFNEDQRARWNGIDGEYWTSNQDHLDRTLAPVMGPLLAFAAPRAGSTVIDVGCGCGATTIELARAVGPSGRVVGIDLSQPMLALAEKRPRKFSNTTCLLGGRCGAAMAAWGRLRFACWRPINENPWLQIPLHAVYEHAPRLPKPDAEEPGPFAFGDKARVTRVLTAAGFTEPSFTPLDIQMDIAAGGTLEDAVNQSSAMGPAKRALADQPEDIRAAALESIRRALTPYASAAGVKLPGAVWLVAADRSA